MVHSSRVQFVMVRMSLLQELGSWSQCVFSQETERGKFGASTCSLIFSLYLSALSLSLAPFLSKETLAHEMEPPKVKVSLSTSNSFLEKIPYRTSQSLAYYR